MTDLYTINVYDPAIGAEVTLQVTKEIYDEFRRGQWRIDKNDDKHKANETQFSALHGGADGAFENFHEFVDHDTDPEELLFKALAIEKLYSALDLLDKAERELIEALYFEDMSERKYAEKKSVYRNAIHKRKVRVLEKLKKSLV